MTNRYDMRLWFLGALVLAVCLGPTDIHADSNIRTSMGQTVYVPSYSHIFTVSERHELQLSANLSIRNTDLRNTITILSVGYYNTEGDLIERKLGKPKKLKPLASWYSYVPTADTKGGWGANFIVKWKSDSPVNIPIIENLMAGSLGTQGYTFVSKAQEITENP